MSKTPKILLACADVAYGATLEQFLLPVGLEIERCHDAKGVLRLASRHAFEVAVLDLSLDAEGGVDLVSFLRERNPAAHLLLLFEMDAIDRAIAGLRRGAFFYLPVTSPPSDVALAVEKALKSRAAQETIDGFAREAFEELFGHSPAMRRVAEMIQKVAPTDSTVLVLGESGTGKEVMANTIHRLSRRHDKPFVAINCAALPEALLESEMFGHVKGAFTGAVSDKRGLFDEADGGTLFLDEVGDMAAITQAKLLRVLQSGEIRPVGSAQSRHVDVRILAATNQDLVEAVRNMTFREDLYFRLNVIQIRIPPLRERMDAMPALVAHFLDKHNARYGKQVTGLDEHAASLLSHYEFPGNVRELESIIAHAVIMTDGCMITGDDLPEVVRRGHQPRLALPYDAHKGILSLSEVEARHIAETLERLDGNQTNTAAKLGISRSTLWRKMKEYDIAK